MGWSRYRIFIKFLLRKIWLMHTIICDIDGIVEEHRFVETSHPCYLAHKTRASDHTLFIIFG